MKKVLVLSENPPISYLNALNAVELKYDCAANPKSFSPYGGLLLIGGGDLLPALYGGNSVGNSVNLVRDRLEFSALEYFTVKELPVLGVCRGLQAINVFFGGTLKCVDRHIGKDGKDAFHGVKAVPPCKFDLSSVNSYHRQAIDKAADNALIALLSDDGVVEMATFGTSVIGVQFHPERMDDRAVQRIYGAFANCVKGKSVRK